MGGTLVIQPLPGIGDMVWHLPHLEAIAAATEQRSITLLTKRRSRADELFAGVAHVREVLWLDRAQRGDPAGRHDGILGAWRLGQDLRGHGFDTVWVLHASPRYALAAQVAGIRERIGFGIGWQNAFLTSAYTLSREDRHLHQAAKAGKLLQMQALPVDPTPRFDPPAAARRAIESAFGSRPRPWLGLGIGSSEPFKQWGAANFAALARAAVDRTGGTVFLMGGPDETDLAEAVLAASRDGVVAALDLSLGRAAALSAAVDVFLGNDTGMLNLAAATGVPSVGLFGGSRPLSLYPNLTALEPPGGAEYRRDRMSEIPVEEAMMALSVLLSPPIVQADPVPR